MFIGVPIWLKSPPNGACFQITHSSKTHKNLKGVQNSASFYAHSLLFLAVFGYTHIRNRSGDCFMCYASGSWDLLLGCNFALVILQSLQFFFYGTSALSESIKSDQSAVVH